MEKNRSEEPLMGLWHTYTHQPHRPFSNGAPTQSTQLNCIPRGPGAYPTQTPTDEVPNAIASVATSILTDLHADTDRSKLPAC
jgi:hypothetical protein